MRDLARWIRHHYARWIRRRALHRLRRAWALATRSNFGHDEVGRYNRAVWAFYEVTGRSPDHPWVQA